jgi:hypothetical protein
MAFWLLFYLQEKTINKMNITLEAHTNFPQIAPLIYQIP